MSLSSIAHAADPKAKKKSSSTTEISDDKGIGKTLSWEDKVMGEDDKRGELDKILKAQAINKAATEKAEREKAKADAAAAKEAAKEAAAPKPAKKNSEVSIGALPDEGPSKGSSKAKATEISPKLETAAAAAPPPPAKPADDKFIDKLLRDDGGSGKKKRVSATDDRALQDLLGEDKPKAATGKQGKGKKSEVDSLLDNADKEPEVVTTKVKHETPEWAKPEIQSAPPPAPVVARPVQRHDDGVIRVVQGAAGGAGAKPLAPPPAEPVVSRSTTPPGRKQAAMPAARGGRAAGWDDPFATESTAPKKTTASRRMMDDDFAPAAPAPRKNLSTQAAKSGGWDDPFADSGSRTAGKRPAPVATASTRPVKGGGSWKDPFTDDSASSKSRRAEVAPPAKTTARKTVAARDSEDADSAPAPSHSRWGVLKKR